MTFRSSISTGKPEKLLSLMWFFFRFPEVERMVYAALSLSAEFILEQ